MASATAGVPREYGRATIEWIGVLAAEGTFYRRELESLYSKGYRLARDGKSLVPPNG